MEDEKNMENMTKFLIVFGLIGLLMLNVGGLGDKAKGLFATSTITGTTGTPSSTSSTGTSTICPDTSATVTLLSQDKYNVAATLTGSDTLFVKDDGAWVDKGAYADGSSVSLGMGRDYQVIFRENSTSYYPLLASGVVGYPEAKMGEGNKGTCTGAETVSAKLLAYDTSVGKGYIVDKDGSLNADGAYNIAAGESVTATVHVPITSKKGFGTGTANNVIVCEYNVTEFSSFSLSDGGSKNADGTPLATTSAVSAPTRYANNLTGSPGKAVFGFAPVESNGEVIYKITAVADSTYGATPSQNPYCRYYDSCIYRDTVTDSITQGLEDTQATTTDKCQTTSMNTTWSLS